MNRGIKITLIVVGSLALAGGITYAIVVSVRKKREQKEKQEKELQETQQLIEIKEGLESQQTTKPSQTTKITPKRNLDKGLNNSFNEIKGVLLAPARKSENPVEGHIYAYGYANIRETPEVNNARGWFIDFNSTNLLGKVNAGSSIGTIISEQYDNLTPKMRWFRVKLTNKIGNEQYGWVRSDNVTFVPFTKKKSSFDGSFVEKYDNSYQLGAEVFPHSNWMIGYPAYGNDITSDFEGNLDLDI